jgi:hypothetical protein
MQDYHKLEIWQRAMICVVQIYEYCALLPDVEKPDLTDDARVHAAIG